MNDAITAIRIIRPIFNTLLTLGYVIGIILVWAGLETLTIEEHNFALGVFIVVCGLTWWTMLNIIGHWWSRWRLSEKTKG